MRRCGRGMFNDRGRNCSFADRNGNIPGFFKQPVEKARVYGVLSQTKDGQNRMIVPKSEPTTDITGQLKLLVAFGRSSRSSISVCTRSTSLCQVSGNIKGSLQQTLRTAIGYSRESVSTGSPIKASCSPSRTVMYSAMTLSAPETLLSSNP